MSWIDENLRYTDKVASGSNSGSNCPVYNNKDGLEGFCQVRHVLWIITISSIPCPLFDLLKHCHRVRDKFGNSRHIPALNLIELSQRVSKNVVCLKLRKVHETPVLQRQSSYGYQRFRIPGVGFQMLKNPHCCLVYAVRSSTCGYHLCHRFYMCQIKC